MSIMAFFRGLKGLKGLNFISHDTLVVGTSMSPGGFRKTFISLLIMTPRPYEIHSFMHDWENVEGMVNFRQNWEQV